MSKQEAARLTVEALRCDLPGASEVVSLATGLDGSIYGGTTGDKGHLFFRFDPATRSVADLGHLVTSGTQLRTRSKPIEQKIHHALVPAPDGAIYGATGQNVAMGGPWYKTDEDEGGHVFRFDPGTGQCEDLGIPVPHEWIINLASNVECTVLYGMTYPLNHLFSCDLASGRMRMVGQVRGLTTGDSGASHEIICDVAGNVYGSCGEGYLFRYEPGKGEIVETDIRLPGESVRLDSLARDTKGLVYGACWESGHLFSFEPARQKVTVLGQPNPGPRLPALVFGTDGLLYGAAGGGDQYNTRTAFIFSYDPGSGKTEEVGDIFDPDSGIRGQRMHAMTVGLDGVLYAGETGAERKVAGQAAEEPYLYICKVAR
jgi:sugar lactone lactonase YvrE